MSSEANKMVEFKLTIADPKTGKCAQKVVEGDAAKAFIGLKIGDSIKGETMDITGYEFLITGGSDYCGFPMRKGIQGMRKRVLIGTGVGFKGAKKGIKRRKTVCGEAINSKIIQINLKIAKQGKANLFEEKKEAPKEEAKEEKPAEKEAAPPKSEEKKEKGGKEEKAEEKPAEKKE
jgi:small subunit ribosomal protein S6e